MRISLSPPYLRKASLNVLGLNSGTSVDGLDMALVRFAPASKPEVLISNTYIYSDNLKKRVMAAGELNFNNGIEWLNLDRELGILMGTQAERFLTRAYSKGLWADCIGSHGQTVRHLPGMRKGPMTLQIGDPALISSITCLPVVADFRRSDLAAGGQGAPLSPVLHEALFTDNKEWRAIVNIGGISNATILPPIVSSSKPLAGDCGPGNMPIDMAMQKLFGRPFDHNGKAGAKGQPVASEVHRVLRMSYFAKRPPKSTGRELFGREFVENIMKRLSGYPAPDIIATFTDITAFSIADFIKRFSPKVSSVFICGGGASNSYLISRIGELLPKARISLVSELGYDPDYLEAVLWAFLAYSYATGRTIYTRRFTGAQKPYTPGRLCLP